MTHFRNVCGVALLVWHFGRMQHVWDLRGMIKPSHAPCAQEDLPNCQQGACQSTKAMIAMEELYGDVGAKQDAADAEC